MNHRGIEHGDTWAMASPIFSTDSPSVSGLDGFAKNAVIKALSQMKERIEIEESQAIKSGSSSTSIRVHNPRFYREVVLRGSLGAADAYQKGWWDAEDLTELFRIFLGDAEHHRPQRLGDHPRRRHRSSPPGHCPGLGLGRLDVDAHVLRDHRTRGHRHRHRQWRHLHGHS